MLHMTPRPEDGTQQPSCCSSDVRQRKHNLCSWQDKTCGMVRQQLQGRQPAHALCTGNCLSSSRFNTCNTLTSHYQDTA